VDGIEVYSVAIGRQQGRVCAVVDYHTGDKSMSDAINREADIRTLMAQTGMSRTEAAFVLAIESGEIAGDIIELGVSDEAPETVARPGQQRTERHDLDND
jgi:NACalpha-BTF3-like transcription factor